jgi:hypothetical protein
MRGARKTLEACEFRTFRRAAFDGISEKPPDFVYHGSQGRRPMLEVTRS